MVNNRIEEVKKEVETAIELGLKSFEDGTEIAKVKEIMLDDIMYEICQLFPQPLDDKVREKALLTKEEREKCVPSGEELTEYLATPDDAIATELRKRLPETDFRELGLLILYNEKCIKAQQDQDFALLQPKIEEAKRQEKERIIRLLRE